MCARAGVGAATWLQLLSDAFSRCELQRATPGCHPKAVGTHLAPWHLQHAHPLTTRHTHTHTPCALCWLVVCAAPVTLPADPGPAVVLVQAGQGTATATAQGVHTYVHLQQEAQLCRGEWDHTSRSAGPVFHPQHASCFLIFHVAMATLQTLHA